MEERLYLSQNGTIVSVHPPSDNIWQFSLTNRRFYFVRLSGFAMTEGFTPYKIGDVCAYLPTDWIARSTRIRRVVLHTMPLCKFVVEMVADYVCERPL